MAMNQKVSRCALLTIAILLLITLSISTQMYSQETGDIKSRVEQFVHKRYIHGVPYMEAKQLGIEALPILEAMLDDTREEEYWTTIIMVMGFIGHESMVDVLVDFLENRFEGEVSVNQFRALLVVNSALGHIAGNGSTRALDYLAKACYVKTWMEKALKWSYRRYSGENLAILLAKIGVNGLSFSGTERARKILTDLEKSPESAKSAIALRPNIEEGLERIQRLQKDGALKVFGGQ